ncbi:hypothetical protein KFL_001720120 [Klebsormidium nitens]|uniref:Uncharacterized protein n=1 Tax=Klebsormidium nitens TaxID=105231 RepID=A0A0U9HLT1_KLENI|nr:hypothetical protein KFL_001720120 [Klebsormidium nitens]|eukprot:GAQ84000.1 hypothetical protein KFL_001720120 [Klebsormidium nitens]
MSVLVNIGRRGRDSGSIRRFRTRRPLDLGNPGECNCPIGLVASDKAFLHWDRILSILISYVALKSSKNAP